MVDEQNAAEGTGRPRLATTRLRVGRRLAVVVVAVLAREQVGLGEEREGRRRLHPLDGLLHGHDPRVVVFVRRQLRDELLQALHGDPVANGLRREVDDHRRPAAERRGVLVSCRLSLTRWRFC